MIRATITLAAVCAVLGSSPAHAQATATGGARGAPPAAPATGEAPRTPEVKLTGSILLNGFWNDGRTDNTDDPTLALAPAVPPALPEGNLGGSIRQTRLGVVASLEGFKGGTLRGELDVDAYGGQFPSSGGRTFPVLRLRRAFLEQRWLHWHLLVGQESPAIVGVNPSSLGAVGIPSLAKAGNLWLWLPQVRLTALTAEPGRVRLGLETSVLAPTSGDPQAATVTTDADRAERSGRPYLQGRALVRWGDGDDEGEVSIGGHLGWLVTSATTIDQSRALAVSVRAPVAHVAELRGEFVTGQGLAGLGGGGIGQNLDPLAPSVRVLPTTMGWGQLLLRPDPEVELGVLAGADVPDVSLPGIAVATAATPATPPAAFTVRVRNVMYGGHMRWSPAPLVLGLEARRIETDWAGPATLTTTFGVWHLNLAVGFQF